MSETVSCIVIYPVRKQVISKIEHISFKWLNVQANRSTTHKICNEKGV